LEVLNRAAMNSDHQSIIKTVAIFARAAMTDCGTRGYCVASIWDFALLFPEILNTELEIDPVPPSSTDDIDHTTNHTTTVVFLLAFLNHGHDEKLILVTTLQACKCLLLGIVPQDTCEDMLLTRIVDTYWRELTDTSTLPKGKRKSRTPVSYLLQILEHFDQQFFGADADPMQRVEDISNTIVFMVVEHLKAESSDMRQNNYERNGPDCPPEPTI
jgi:hypothetical protein